MLRGREVIGKSVVTIETGERLPSVKDLIFDAAGGEVLAFLLEEGSWLHPARVIPFGLVRSIGEDALIIGRRADVRAARDVARVNEVIREPVTLIGTALMTTEGDNLGRLADLYFDERTGHISGYEVTGGMFSDLASGRSYVPAPEHLNLGRQVAFVPTEVAHQMEEQEPGGLQGAFSAAGQRVSTAAGSVSDSVRSAAGSVSDSFHSAIGSVSDTVRDQQRAFVIGKTAGGDVSDATGALVIGKGQVITPMDAERAETLGVLGALVTSAGGGALQAGWAATQAQVQTGYDNVSDSVRERQKTFVVGKTAGSVVEAADGTPIAAQGAVITLPQAELAEEHGALGSLFAAAGGGTFKGAAGTLADRAQTGYDAVSAGVQAQQKAFVVGKTASRTVSAPDGTLITPQGAVITALEADIAGDRGALGQLVVAAGGGALQDGWTATQARVQAGYASIVSASAEQQKTFVSGKTAGPAVLGDDHSLIAATGEVVTPELAERAEARGALGRLVLSVGGAAVQSGLDSARLAVLPDARERVQETLGRRVQDDVRGPAGSLVAATGQIVTQGIIEQATSTGREAALVAAVRLDQPITRRLNATTTALGDRLAEGAENLRTGTSTLVDRTRSWLARQSAETAQAAEARDVRNALGRPVTRVILDPQDRIILNLGEIVTHRAVKEAREGGVLRILTASVSRIEPQISPLDVRPTVSGDAALESQGAAAQQGTTPVVSATRS